MKHFFAVLLSFLATGLYAQKFTDKAVKQCCECLTKLDMTMDPKALDVKATKCIEDATLTNLAGLMKEHNLNLGDEAASERLGEKIGMELVQKCPAFMEYVKNMPDDEEAKSEDYTFAEGKISAAAKTEYIILTLEEASGDSRVFYLIDYFPDAEKIVEDFSTIKNKKVKIGYTTRKVFDKESNDFKERKIIAAFDYKN